MKNIHIIGTDKPSRLYLTKEGFYFLLPNIKGNDVKFQHIYITSDEEIKDGDWVYLQGLNKVIQCVNIIDGLLKAQNAKKIILTTDQDLIADGVQAIPNEFLKWFVKNPSCESVEVLRCPIEGLYTIISKEEPKQENCCTPIGQIKRYVDCVGCDRKPKQETLEEAGLQHCDMLDKFPELVNPLFTFKQGAKWQQERSYTDGIDLFIAEIKSEFKDDNWDYLEFIKERVLEQFKKK
jgi:hypothetical protein